MKMFTRRIKERRRYPRVNDCLRINYQMANDVPHANCVTRDISAGGIRLNLYQKVQIGTVLKLGIDLRDHDDLAWAIGKVVWTKETPTREYPYEAGIEFYFFGPAFRSRIQNHIQAIMETTHAEAVGG